MPEAEEAKSKKYGRILTRLAAQTLLFGLTKKQYVKLKTAESSYLYLLHCPVCFCAPTACL
jgi:hypothetical protein